MKIRIDRDANYKAIFFNYKTVRQRIDSSKPILSPKFAEIEDVAINNKCLAACSYCYTNAMKSGINFNNIVEKADQVWGSREMNDRPFQIAIGGAGESTMHPDWIPFVKKVNELGIVPNYTTNGMHLYPEILEATKKYCGGVAVSYHPHISKMFHEAIDKLSGFTSILNAHVIVSDSNSLSDLKAIFMAYRRLIDYFVVLPYQAAGRAVKIETESTWKEMFTWINSLPNKLKSKFAFGALFYPYLQKNDVELNIDIYEPEIYSGYRIFDDSFMNLRKSSYDLTIK